MILEVAGVTCWWDVYGQVVLNLINCIPISPRECVLLSAMSVLVSTLIHSMCPHLGGGLNGTWPPRTPSRWKLWGHGRVPPLNCRPLSWVHSWHNTHLNLLVPSSPQSAWTRPEVISSLNRILQGSLFFFFFFLFLAGFKAASRRTKPLCIKSSGVSSVLAELPLTQHGNYREEHPWQHSCLPGRVDKRSESSAESTRLPPVSLLT